MCSFDDKYLTSVDVNMWLWACGSLVALSLSRSFSVVTIKREESVGVQPVLSVREAQGRITSAPPLLLPLPRQDGAASPAPPPPPPPVVIPVANPEALLTCPSPIFPAL